ncbi:MAG: helix-turn-helix transcriptional regulator [Firmicutes bacterium]|nr:helix-turn-helix transcriptional regulator [Bacillota bacterium]
MKRSPVKRLRKEKGPSQQELAERVMISQGHLKRIEYNISNAPIRLLARLAKELGVPVEQLIQAGRRTPHGRRNNKIPLSCVQ